MSVATLYGLCSAALVGLGLYGLIVQPEPLRKVLAFNLIGGGVFLLMGVVARRGAAAGFGGGAGRPVVVGAGCSGWRAARRWLCIPRARPRWPSRSSRCDY
jgi:NADH-ubiquinone/plastoquinone oxidoreductase chain 4L